MQSDQDAARYLELGASSEAVAAIGNLKYDAEPSRAEPPRVHYGADREAPSRRPIWIAASTMAGVDRDDVDEDDAVLSAFRNWRTSHPELLLILVPRKPERFDEAEAKLRSAGLRYIRRSQESIPADLALPCVVLLDSIGELASLFPIADVVFMGGTLARRGGHNVLEPAACRKAIVTGPHLENFAAIAAEFRERRAFLEIRGASELAGAVASLVDNRELREDLGARAAALAAGKRGAAKKAVAEILRWQDLAVPCWNQLSPARFLLWPLASFGAAVSELQQRRKIAHARRLATPVVSVGGISMGGAGKTPMVDYLAERLSDCGYHPAILTRGYRRRSIETSILVEAGESAPVSFTGDEAQIFVQSGYAHSGIGADRFVTGRLLEERYRPDIFLLDDGFQHTRLRRDLDLVVLDALNPFGGGAVFPLGNLREPLGALSRAGAFVIMRAAPEREYAGIVRQIPGAQSACADLSRASGASLLGGLSHAPAAAFPGRSIGCASGGILWSGESGQFLGNLAIAPASASVSLGVRRSSSLQLRASGAPGCPSQDARIECAADNRKRRDEFARQYRFDSGSRRHRGVLAQDWRSPRKRGPAAGVDR